MRRILLILALAGCADPKEQVRCDDALAPHEATFAAVLTLVSSEGAKGCARCHNTRSPVYGYNFEGPAVSHDALSSKMSSVYAQVASGKMPKDGERWSDTDLKLLRSWFCNGGFYEE